MHTKFTGQAVSKGFTRARWFFDWLKLLVRISSPFENPFLSCQNICEGTSHVLIISKFISDNNLKKVVLLYKCSISKWMFLLTDWKILFSMQMFILLGLSCWYLGWDYMDYLSVMSLPMWILMLIERSKDLPCSECSLWRYFLFPSIKNQLLASREKLYISFCILNAYLSMPIQFSIMYWSQLTNHLFGLETYASWQTVHSDTYHYFPAVPITLLKLTELTILIDSQERPKWMKISSLDELKTKVGHVIVMILLVKMFERSKMVTIATGMDLLSYSVCIFLSSASLYILHQLHKPEAE